MDRSKGQCLDHSTNGRLAIHRQAEFSAKTDPRRGTSSSMIVGLDSVYDPPGCCPDPEIAGSFIISQSGR